jgi:hypothetical protein
MASCKQFWAALTPVTDRRPEIPLRRLVTPSYSIDICCHLLIVDCLINMATPQPLSFLSTPTMNSTSQHFLPMQSSMANHPPALTCLIEGDSSMFGVYPTTDIRILDLRKLIHEEGNKGVLRNVDAKDLILWKVRMIMGQRHHN